MMYSTGILSEIFIHEEYKQKRRSVEEAAPADKEDDTEL